MLCKGYFIMLYNFMCIFRTGTNRPQLEQEEYDCAQRSAICPNCNKHYPDNTKFFRYHVKSCKMCICGECGKEYKSQILLQKHSKIHTKDYVCEVCGKSGFVSKQALNRHVKGHSGKKFECPVCGKKFSTKGSLARHDKSTHE